MFAKWDGNTAIARDAHKVTVATVETAIVIEAKRLNQPSSEITGTQMIQGMIRVRTAWPFEPHIQCGKREVPRPTGLFSGWTTTRFGQLYEQFDFTSAMKCRIRGSKETRRQYVFNSPSHISGQSFRVA
jgi:hypothetical protein